MIESIILGLGYQARHGKDTVAAEIIKQRGTEFDIRQYSFARALKQEINSMARQAGGMRNLFLSDLVHLPVWVKHDPCAPMDDPDCPLGKQRALLQYYGCFKRNSDPDHWVKKVAEQIEHEHPELAILTDVRFLNEATFVKQYGDLIKVHRPNFDAGCAHESENALADYQDWDYVIENDGSLADLKRKAVQTFDEIMNKVRTPQ